MQPERACPCAWLRGLFYIAEHMAVAQVSSSMLPTQGFPVLRSCFELIPLFQALPLISGQSLNGRALELVVCLHICCLHKFDLRQQTSAQHHAWHVLSHVLLVCTGPGYRAKQLSKIIQSRVCAGSGAGRTGQPPAEGQGAACKAAAAAEC